MRKYGVRVTIAQRINVDEAINQFVEDQFFISRFEYTIIIESRMIARVRACNNSRERSREHEIFRIDRRR